MKNLILFMFILGTHLASAQTPSRVSLCPQGSIPMSDDLTVGETPFKGVTNQSVKVGETKTYCFSVRNDRSYLFFTGNDRVSNTYERTIHAELSVNGQPFRSYDLGEGFKDIFPDPVPGVYVVKVTGVLKSTANCNSKPSLCKEAMGFSLAWRTMDVDRNVKVSCPLDSVEITRLQPTGWYMQRIYIDGGNTYRFCARLTEPSYGFQANWASRTQKCPFKELKVTPLTYPNLGQKAGSGSEVGVDYRRIMRPQAMLIEISVDPIHKGCNEYGEASWTPGAYLPIR